MQSDSLPLRQKAPRLRHDFIFARLEPIETKPPSGICPCVDSNASSGQLERRVTQQRPCGIFYDSANRLILRKGRKHKSKCDKKEAEQPEPPPSSVSCGRSHVYLNGRQDCRI
jgi:hypothetical protein